jgi:6-phosphofructokinase 2
MLAGIIFCLSQGKDLAQAVQFGVACGTATTLNPGTELFTKEDVEILHPRVNITS